MYSTINFGQGCIDDRLLDKAMGDHTDLYYSYDKGFKLGREDQRFTPSMDGILDAIERKYLPVIGTYVGMADGLVERLLSGEPTKPHAIEFIVNTYIHFMVTQTQHAKTRLRALKEKENLYNELMRIMETLGLNPEEYFKSSTER